MFIWLENSICCPRVDQVLNSAEAFFYQQMILSWFGRFSKLGRERESTPYPPMILYGRRAVRRGQSYAVDSKRSIDLKTQFVAHVLIRYSVLPMPSFINKWFRRGLDNFLSWGESSEYTPYPPMILYARRMVRRGQSYAVNSKHSIDLKTQFVAHVSIRYSVLPRPSFYTIKD